MTVNSLVTVHSPVKSTEKLGLTCAGRAKVVTIMDHGSLILTNML